MKLAIENHGIGVFLWVSIVLRTRRHSCMNSLFPLFFFIRWMFYKVGNSWFFPSDWVVVEGGGLWASIFCKFIIYEAWGSGMMREREREEVLIRRWKRWEEINVTFRAERDIDWNPKTLCMSSMSLSRIQKKKVGLVVGLDFRGSYILLPIHHLVGEVSPLNGDRTLLGRQMKWELENRNWKMSLLLTVPGLEFGNEIPKAFHLFETKLFRREREQGLFSN